MTIVYLLQSVKNPSHFYVGQTTDIVERLQQHNYLKSGSGRAFAKRHF
jgi:predicted GIY-YIG superfamily endonuclease